MANLVEVFTQEWDRSNPSEWNKIHLYKIGDFWRAYEWSAWLISVISYNDNVRMTTKDRKPLHVTRMRRTDIDNATYCFVGFPVKSVEKYIPERETFESVDDKHVVITISLPTPTSAEWASSSTKPTPPSKWRRRGWTRCAWGAITEG